jgi:ABC-type bacteriocin/lantibiotic exporter with double-glycine peptidase domain
LGVMRAAKPALLALKQALSQPCAVEFSPQREDQVYLPVVPLKPQIVRFDEVSYGYPGVDRPVLERLNLDLRLGECLGILGPTGTGKSTLLDLLMGLLVPQSGCIWVDGANLHQSSESAQHLRRWRQGLAHVPQQVFIADTTILANIAFGISAAVVDLDRAKAAAKAAQLDTFIESLPMGYQTSVGERGGFLSGGQRQRLGLARALYKGASLLILDEATSALDPDTEVAVLDAIESIRHQHQITVVMVAHRLSTLSGCDRILQLQPAPKPSVIYSRPFPDGLLGQINA